MKYYKYNPSTLEFQYSYTAQKDPMNEGKYLQQPSSTSIEPPELGENEAARFNPKKKCWEIVADYRSINLYIINKETLNPLTDSKGNFTIIHSEIGEDPRNWPYYNPFMKPIGPGLMYTNLIPNDVSDKWDFDSRCWITPIKVVKDKLHKLNYQMYMNELSKPVTINSIEIENLLPETINKLLLLQKYPLVNSKNLFYVNDKTNKCYNMIYNIDWFVNEVLNKFYTIYDTYVYHNGIINALTSQNTSTKRNYVQYHIEHNWFKSYDSMR